MGLCKVMSIVLNFKTFTKLKQNKVENKTKTVFIHKV